MDSRPTPDTGAMVSALNVRFEPTDIIEFRAFAKGRKRTDAGYFDGDHREELAAHAARLNNTGAAVYITLNSIDPQLLGRYCNRVQEFADATATDANVTRRRWLLVDLDSKRPKNTAATNEQVAKAKALASDIYAFLRESGWPSPIVAESGNGFHLLFPLDMANDDAARELIKGALIGLAAMFDTADVQIDTAVFNAGRITKLYGTVATKGDHTELAPWRLSQLVKVPARDAVVTPEQLQALHVVKQPGQQATHASQPYTGRFSLPDFLTRLGIDYEQDRHDGRDRYKLEHCPFNAEHGKGEAAIFQNANGALGFKCQHTTCAGHGWQDVRALLDGPRETRQPPAMDFTGLTAGKGQGTALQADTPRFNLAERTAARLFKGTPPAQQWLVEGIYPLGKVALLASPPGVGKSFLALDLARKAAGRYSSDFPAVSFGGIVRGYGRTIYVSAEDDEPELHRRLYSLMAGDAMPDRLHVLSLPDVGHFGVIETDPHTRDLRPTAAWLALTEEIRGLAEVRLIVLDTLQALSTGDTNDAAAVQPLMNQCSQLAAATGATVLLLHHVAKGSTKEIKTALDAAEAIRGSGGITGSARTAYVLWPPSDGGRKICETLNEPYIEGAIAIGLVAKANGAARRDRSFFLRDSTGLLRDVTQRYQSLIGDDAESLQAELLAAIGSAWQQGAPFAASHGTNGLHTRRFELPEPFHDKPRPWFDEQVGTMFTAKQIKRVRQGRGFNLAPFEAVETPEELAA